MSRIWWIWSCIALLFPGLVFAAVGFTPPATDYSMAFLANLFGPVDGVLYATGSQIMGTMFAVFNSAVLAIAGIIIMYVMIIATMNTAHEGKFLGQKWSSLWIPIRTVIGLALLFPKSSGFCLMQVLVMWIVVQGVGAADKVWGAALQYLNRGGAIVLQQINTASSQYASSTDTIAVGTMTILAGQVCMLSLQKELQLAQTNFQAQENTVGTYCNQTNTTFTQGTPQYIICTEPVPDFLSSVNFVLVQQQATQAATSASTCACSSGSGNNCQCPAPSGFTALLPNFNSSSSSYAIINGVCGAVEWNAVNTSSASSDSNTNQLNMASMEYSRAMAIQQMYDDLYAVANSMVTNDPKITSQTTSGTSTFNDWAMNQFGVAYLSGDASPCAGTSSSCVLWGPDQVSNVPVPVLFSGTEFQTAIADYDSTMSPTLNMQNQGGQSMENATQFITTSMEDGWMTAGSYFYNIIQLNTAAMNNSSDVDTNSGLNHSSAMCNLQAAFTTTSSCSTNASCSYSTMTGTTASPNVVALCQLFNNISSYVSPIAQLISANGSVANPKFSTNMTAIQGTNSSTTYAFGNNGFLVNLPGQPGATAPTFTLTIVPAMINPPQQPSWGFSCNSVNFLGCLGQMLGHVFINDFFFTWINLLSANISYWFSSYVMTFGWGYLDQLSQYINSAMNSLADNNPIVGLAEMGVQLINFTSQMFVTMILEGIEEAITTLGLALPAVIIVWVIVGTWMGIYVGIGFMTAYYVPMIPYMTFLFGSIGWVIAVIEAMVAAPIMAVGMTYPEGENIFGKGEAGFMILLNVFLRPSLMIIGYIAAIALSYVVVWMLNSGFSQSQSFYGGLGSTTPGAPFFAVSIGLSYTSWASTFVYFFSTLVYTMLYWVSVEKSFTLIYLLPDQILRWIGGQSEHIGAEAARWEQEVKQQVQKGTEGSANFMMSSTGSGDGGDGGDGGGEESSGDGSSSSSGKAPVK